MTSFFSGFTIAKLGIRSSQQGLQITGNNISNINTTGYTRQRIEQISLRSGTTDRYANSTDIRIGMGSLVTNISQIRDPYLDIRYRNEAANVGYYDEKLTNLDDLTSILDEVTKNGLHTGIEELRTQLEKLVDGGSNPNNQELQNAVRGAAQELVSLLNKYSADLKTLKENAVDGLKQNKDTVNTILTNIRDLNVEIRNSQIHGDNALELVDRRNTLIDELAEYVKIKVTYTDEKISEGITVDHLTIELDAPDTEPNDRLTLIDGQFANQFELVEPSLANDDYELSLTGLTNQEGVNPLQYDLEEKMKTLNGLVTALQTTNKYFDALATQRNDWATNIASQGFTQNQFQDPATIQSEQEKLQADVDKAIEDYRNAATDADKELAKTKLDDAKSKLSKFIQFAKQKTEMDKTQSDLEAQRKLQSDKLQTTLSEHGLNMNPNPPAIDADGKISIHITGGSLPAGGVDLLNTQNESVKFGVTTGADGSLNLQVGSDAFNTVQLENELKSQMQDLNDLVKSLQEVNEQFQSLQQREDNWKKIADSFHPDFNADNFANETTITNARNTLQGLLDTAQANYDKDPSDANKKALQEAKDNLTSFNVLADQKADIIASRTDLTTQQGDLESKLKNALTAQGITNYNFVQNPTGDGTVSIDITTGTPAQKVDLLNTANESVPFEAVKDAAGNLSLEVDGVSFKNIPAANLGNLPDTAENLYAGNDLYGVLQADLDHLNGKGEFDEPATSIRGISYYERTLDSFAQQLAETFNDLNNLNNLNGTDSFVKDLFSSSDGVSTITASNITISDAWMSGEISITTSTNPDADDNDFSGTNIHNMIGALNGDQTFYALDEYGNPIKDGNDLRVLFKGSFEEMLVNSNNILGQDVKSSTTLLENYSTAATNRAVARDNVSTVDLNEEGINLIQYQKSFSAACRVMTTLDEMLDSLLNM